MALGIAAVVPPQLAERALVERKDQLVESRSAPVPRSWSGPTTPSTASRSPPASPAGRWSTAAAARQPTVFSFISYDGRKIELRGLDPHGLDGVLREGPGLPSRLHAAAPSTPTGVLISQVMAAGLGLGEGDTIRLRTALGPADAEGPRRGRGRRLALGHRLHGHRPLPPPLPHRRDQRPRRSTGRSKIDRRALRGLPALHTVSGAELLGTHRRTDGQEHPGSAARCASSPCVAALVAVAGIIATAVLAAAARVGGAAGDGTYGNGGLFGALALETRPGDGARRGLRGRPPGSSATSDPTTGFLESQGYVIGGGLAGLTIAAIVCVAVVLGTLAAALPAWLTARAPLADALSYE